MPEITIRPAIIHDGVALAPHMREADRQEVYAASGLSPRAALLASIHGSAESWAGLVNGNLTALFGVFGNAPWLLGTDGVSQVPMTFLRGSRVVADRWSETYGPLENHVDARNETSLRWLKWLGFTIEPAEPWGFEKRAFHRFWKD